MALTARERLTRNGYYAGSRAAAIVGGLMPGKMEQTHAKAVGEFVVFDTTDENGYFAAHDNLSLLVANAVNTVTLDPAVEAADPPAPARKGVRRAKAKAKPADDDDDEDDYEPVRRPGRQTGAGPSHVLKAYNKVTGVGNKVGAGFQRENGRIGIYIDQCVVLQAHPDMSFILFPVDDEGK